MRWNEIKKDETLNSQFNKLKDIIFAYFKGTIKDKIGHNSNNDLVEKFPLEYTNAKISLLVEIFRRTVQERLNEKFLVLNDYVYQEGILSDDEMAFLSEPTRFHIMAEYVLDTTSIPEHNLYPLPENLADYLLSKEREIFDVNRVLIINSGLGELVSSRVLWNKNEGTDFKNTNDSISDLNRYDIESTVDFIDFDSLGFALTAIRKEAKKLAFASHGHFLNKKESEPFIDSDMFNYDTIVYFSNKLEKGKEDMFFAAIYEKMKPNAHLVMIVNRDWVLYPYAHQKKETELGLGKMFKDHSIVSVTELPKDIWRQTENSTYIIVVRKTTEKSDDESVLFVDASSCKTIMKDYSLDYAKLCSSSLCINMKNKYGYDISTASRASWEQIDKEFGIMLPGLYIDFEEEPINNHWGDFDNVCEKCEFKGSIYASSVIQSTFLYLVSEGKIHLVAQKVLEDLDYNPQKWVEYLSFTNEDIENKTDEDNFLNEFQPCSIYKSNNYDSSERFCFQVLDDVLLNCNKLEIYHFLSFIYRMISDNEASNHRLCYDAFLHKCYWIHVLNESNYGIPELSKAIFGTSKDSTFFPYIEFASDKDGILLPCDGNYLFEEYCKNKLLYIWKGQYSFDIYASPLKKGAHKAVFATPLLGATYLDSNGKEHSLDPWIIRHGLESLTETGRFVGVFPASILTRSNKELFELRKYLTDNNLLEQVILLPRGIMEHTNIAVCMILLRKGRDESDPIMLVNASNCSTEKWNHLAIDVNRVTELIGTKADDYVTITNVQNIVENGYTWSPLHFWSNEIEVPEGYSSVRFNEIATQIKGTRAGKNEKASVISIMNLHTSPFDYEQPSSFEFLLSFWNKRIAKIKEPVLLLSSVRGLRPTFCNASKSSPIYVDSSVYAFRINTDKVSLPYLMYYLSRVDQALNEGSTVPRNSLLSINTLKIVYPESLSAQKIAVEEGKRAYIQNKIEESGLKAEIERMKTEYINEVRMRKHDMKTPLAQLVNSFTLIDKFLDKIQGNKEEVDNIRIFLGRQKVALDNLQGQLQRLSDEDVYGNPERFNLEDALRHIVPSSNRYTVNYRRDNIAFNEAEIETAFVKMNPANFTSIVNNILDNALRHGFVDDTRSDYRVDITLTIEDNMFVINFANNGVPFPDGLSAERYGIKGESAGKNAGTGIGGYRIKSISEHFSGKFSLKTTRQKEEILSNVIIKLPILFDDEEV